MKHVFWVVPNRLAGRPGPFHVAWDPAALAAGGVSAVLSLDPRGVDADAVAAAGLAHRVVELPADDRADAETERACTAALPEAQRFLEEQTLAGRPPLVHCNLGRDRTALALAHQIACEGDLDADCAIARVRDHRPDALFAPGWEPMALRVIDALMARRPRRQGRRRYSEGLRRKRARAS